MVGVLTGGGVSSVTRAGRGRTTRGDSDTVTNGLMRMRQSINQFESAFEQQKVLEQRRREQLRSRAVNRSRARRVARSQQQGKVRFSVLAVCLTVTVVVVTIAMFEALAFFMS